MTGNHAPDAPGSILTASQAEQAPASTPTPAVPPAADSGLSWSCDECQVGGHAPSRFGAIYAELLHRARAHGGVLPATRANIHAEREIQ